jgi:hypothetical protein
VNRSTELREFFENLNVAPRFTARAVSIPGDFRIAWRLSVLCLLLQRGRANALSLEHLHVLWWAARSERGRSLVTRWFDGERSPDELLVRFDPSLTVTVDLALGQGLVTRTASGAVKLTEAGVALAAAVQNEKHVLGTVKEFLDSLPRKITQQQIRELLEWK